MEKKDFILASGSPQRHQLLAQIGYIPKEIIPADIDEQVLPDEEPLPYIRRISRKKALSVAENRPKENILSADTIIVVGHHIIRKSDNAAMQTDVMHALSGRTHRVITSVCLIDKNQHIHQRTVTTKIIMKHLTDLEITQYIKSKEWVGVAGYKIEGMLQGYVKRLVGSYSNVVGLPLYETKNMLNGIGIY